MNAKFSLIIVSGYFIFSNAKILFGEEVCRMVNARDVEPTVELGTPTIKVGKTRQMRVSVKQCPNCLLVFYEGITE